MQLTVLKFVRHVAKKLLVLCHVVIYLFTTNCSKSFSYNFFLITQQKPNVRINPPRDDTLQASRSQQMMMKGKLRALGFNELLDSALHRNRQDKSIKRRYVLPEKITHRRMREIKLHFGINNSWRK